MADPVASRSAFLRTYMSSHPDTLVAYAKWFGKVPETIKSAEMTAIDTKSMTLKCTLANGTKKDVRVEISPPLRGYDDVKPRLLEMKAVAQEGLGMIKAPRIDNFQFPAGNLTLVTVGLVLGVLYIHCAPPDSTSALWAPAKAAAAYPYVSSTVKAMYKVIPPVHAVESLYTLYLCYTHSTPLIPTVQYLVATWVLGFNVWSDLRKRIQSARIDSVMKVE